MKINEETIQQLQDILADYIAEAGEREGKYLFSKELGVIENKLYSETVYTSLKIDSSDCTSGITGYEIEGELPVVEDPDLLPVLEAV